jgi:formamidopyrimidine-DNA glycosylase
MPEIPDLDVYVEAVASRVVGHELLAVRLGHPFLLRTVEPSLDEARGRTVSSVRRLGKRVVIELGSQAEPALFLVLHLMIAGRLHWRSAGAALQKGRGLVSFDFASGSLQVTEAGRTRRASLHVVRGEEALAALDPGGLEVQSATPAEFATALRSENRTLKRALTDPRIISGIGTAYSDEILHRARLSPFKLTGDLADADVEALRGAVLTVLDEWTQRLRDEAGDGFPEHVTAFRPEMAVHGRFGEPCPVCGTSVQRIVYAENECDYCPRCQTGGRLLADRALSRLLKESWPKTVDEWERSRSEGGSR